MSALIAGRFTLPCQPTHAATPPSGPGWVHEIKYDGYRVQVHVIDGRVTIFSRNGHDWTHRFGLLAGQLAALGVHDTVLDGEAVVFLPGGLSDYHRLREELSRGGRAEISLIAFDLLWLNGCDVRERALIERKSMLKMLLLRRGARGLVHFGDHASGEGDTVFARAAGLGVEGIVSKRGHAPYRGGRSSDWLKIKLAATDDLVVVGYVDMKGARGIVGALVVASRDDTTMRYAGRVGTGFSAKEAAEIWDLLQPLRAKPSTLAGKLDRAQRQGVTWVEPRLVVEVEHRGWSPDGILRQAAFKRFRPDKSLAPFVTP